MKRIQILEKGWKKSNWYKAILIIPVIAAMILVFSCQNDKYFSPKYNSNLPEGWTLIDRHDPEFELFVGDIQKLKRDNPGEYFAVKNDLSYGYFYNKNWNTVWLIRMSSAMGGIVRYYPNGDSPQESPLNINDFMSQVSFQDEQIATANEIFTIVEEQPTPEGGMAALYQYIQENLKYPEQAKQDTIQGKVYVQFVVNKEGEITEAQVLKGIGGGCDEEAVRVIANSPKWIPGKQRGNTVSVRMILPITFNLD